MSNLNPQALDAIQYTAYSNIDPSLEVSITGTSEAQVKIDLLDKIGYAVVLINGEYFVVDADDQSMIESKLTSTNGPAALDETFKLIDWTVCEPVQLIGGSLGGGFGLEENS